MSKKDQNIPQPVLFDAEEMGRITPGDIWEEKNKPVTCLGMEFPNDDARRKYFRDELRKKLPELRQIEGFPIGKDEDIIRLSDPPYYTACPNPWLNDFIAQWEEEKKQLEIVYKTRTNTWARICNAKYDSTRSCRTRSRACRKCPRWRC